MPDLWTIASDTDGQTCEVDDVVSRALCSRPELRGLSPKDLADELGVGIGEAQVGILRLASRASGVKVVLRGVSFDDAIAAGGRALGRYDVAYAREAGATGESGGNGSHSPWPAIFLFGFAMIGLAVGLEALNRAISGLPSGEGEK